MEDPGHRASYEATSEDARALNPSINLHSMRIVSEKRQSFRLAYYQAMPPPGRDVGTYQVRGVYSIINKLHQQHS